MSHFTVLVAYSSDTDLDSVLLPYHEAECTGYKEYCVWDDSIHHEYLKDYNEGFQTVVVKNGKIIGKRHDDIPEIKAMWKKEHPEDFFENPKFELADGYDLLDVPYSEYYGSFDTFMEKYAGITEKNPETGLYSSFTNPNAKWDWWQVGGRWHGTLLTKNGLYVDEEMSQNIDWNRMAELKSDSLANDYELFHAKYNEPVIVEDSDVDKYNEWVKRNPEVTNVIPNAELMKKVANGMNAVDYLFWGVREYQSFMKPKEEYIIPSAITYAFIDLDGNWNQKGEMGWWGMDDPSKATECYNGEFWQFVQNLPENINVAVVDCHI